jgi:hypothetical protein
MPRMVRKQVYITPEQDRILKRCAARRGVTEAEVIREGIEAVAVDRGAAEQKRAWQELVRDMRERADRLEHLGRPGAPRTWSKEDAYEDDLRWPPR